MLEISLRNQAKALPSASAAESPTAITSLPASPAKSSALAALVEAKKTLNQDLANIEQLERERVFDKAEAAAQKKVVSHRSGVPRAFVSVCMTICIYSI